MVLQVTLDPDGPPDNTAVVAICASPNDPAGEAGGWFQIETGGWNAMVLFDLAAYYFYVENYPDCRKCLTLIKTKVQPEVTREYLSYPVLEGYYTALLTGQETLQQETDK